MPSIELHPVIQTKINELQHRYPMTDHPLIKGITVRQFNEEQMHLIAERFFHVIRNFPRFIAQMIAHWDDTFGRMPLVENLFEEHGRMDRSQIHVVTYLEFLREMGLDVDRIRESEATPSTIAYVRGVLDMCSHGHPNLGLGTLAYIEDIVHQVSALIGHAAKKERTHLQSVSHFSEHEILDDQHSQEIYHMLSLANDEETKAALSGLTMGAFFHHQMYDAILSEVVFLTGARREDLLIPKTKISPLSYPLQTGDAGKLRLDTLNRLYNAQSLDFIEQNVSREACFVLEFGCGTGTLSYELALRHKAWQILAVDNADAQIAMAGASYEVVANLQFETMDLEKIRGMRNQFDVIYVRWVLIYQKDLAPYLSAFLHALKPSGLLIVEDNEPGNSGCYSPTHQNYIDNWQNFWTQAVGVVGQEPGLCARLMEEAHALGFRVAGFNVNQQPLTTKEEKEVFAMGIVESKDAILAAGVPYAMYDEIEKNALMISAAPLPVLFVRNFQLCFAKRIKD